MKNPSSRVYMGVDLQEGSPGSSSRQARYYIVIIDEEGRLIGKYPNSTLSRLVRLAVEYRPVSIGLDNIYELGASERDIVRLLSFLPDETQVVQVNVLDDVVTLKEAARKAGIGIDSGKLSPGKTAYLAALLASKGVGLPVKSMEEKTIIVVSKSKSSSKGGWSQQRFQRALRAIIHYTAMDIKEALDRAGLEYDYRYRKSVGGFESAIFIVYARRDRVRSIIREGESYGCRIRIKPVYRVRLDLPQKSSKKPSRSVIVGVDPGSTTGLAILDTMGNLLYLESMKSVDPGEILEVVRKYGKPLIVAVDVKDPPESIRRIAAKTGAEIYTPSSDMEVQEKREIAYSFLESKGISLDLDSHKRDALAAAYKAYTMLRAKLSQIEAHVRKLGLPLNTEKIKAEVLRGKTIAESIEKEIERVLFKKGSGREGPAAEYYAAAPTTEPRGGVLKRPEPEEQLMGTIESLEAEKRLLENRIKELERRLEEAEIKVREHFRQVKAEAVKDEMVVRLRQRISLLEGEIKNLKESLEAREAMVKSLVGIIACIGRGECVPVRSVKVLTSSSFKRTERLLGPLRKGEIVHVEDVNVFEKAVLEELHDRGVRAILIEGETSPFQGPAESRMIPVVSCSGLVVDRVGDIVVVRAEVLGKIEDARRELERRKALSLNLEKLINSYRESRKSAR
ncbi:MAG: DUF460 domain-containing protein [Desulfurococcales archaeon]|nr:DUF460 domain-containing protein [Desulfurococcales archaeon]